MAMVPCAHSARKREVVSPIAKGLRSPGPLTKAVGAWGYKLPRQAVPSPQGAPPGSTFRQLSKQVRAGESDASNDFCWSLLPALRA